MDTVLGYSPADLVRGMAEAVASGAREIFRLLNEHGGIPEVDVQDKDHGDPVSIFDTASQDAIQQRLRQFGEGFDFLGEENQESHKLVASKKPLWVVDPLEGTVIFVTSGGRVPDWAINIALLLDGVVLCCVILFPNQRKLYFATKGGGAFEVPTDEDFNVLADKAVKFQVPPGRHYKTGMTMGLPPARKMSGDALASHYGPLSAAEVYATTRQMGCAAANCLQVALGYVDCYIPAPGGTNIYDAAPGVRLLIEAGASVCVFDPENRQLVCAVGGVEVRLKTIKVNLTFARDRQVLERALAARGMVLSCG